MSLAARAAPVEATPGSPSLLRVAVTNTGEAPTSVSLSVAGMDPAWLSVPEPFGPLPPGATVVAEIAVTVPVGHPPCELAVSVTATDAGGSSASADVVVGVRDGSVVSAAVEPAEARGGWTGRARVVLRNRSKTPVRVDLHASSPEPDLRVRFDGSTQLLQPGQEVRVPTRLSARRRLAGGPTRRPYAVLVRTRGTPVQLEAAFVQRAVLSAWMTKVVALAAVAALWVAVAAVGITDLSKHVNNTANQRAANNAPPLSTPSGPSGGSGPGAGGPGGSGVSAGTGGPGGAGGAASTPSRLSGKVTAAQPGGVTVRVTPTSLEDQTSQAATVASLPASPRSPVELVSATAPLAKLYGADLPDAPAPSPTARLDALTTTTSPDGFWAVAGITAPGYYLVSFSKPGYATADYVVDIPGGGKAVTLQARLVPGNGALSGTVSGPHGPLGGVQLTITDGTVSLTTRTPTEGQVGDWRVTGLTTPDTYLVTATLPGYSTQTTLETLGAGASQSGIDLTMVPGEGSISGTVVSSVTGQPVGGLTVTATSAAETRTTTTTTVAQIGTYDLPDLPVPGSYALTISGDGYVSQTEQVTLAADPSTDNATVNATVTPSGADVTGVVTASDTGKGLAGAGLVLSNQTNVYKTLTTSTGTPGSFDFGQVPPGEYVLSAEAFGYTTESAQVSVGPGQTQTVDLTLPFVGQQSLATATIQGSVASLITAKAVIGAQISLDGKPVSATTNAQGQYVLKGVNPGTHTVTASCSQSSPCESLDLNTNALAPEDFETTTVQVTVALGAVAFAPPILMPKLDRLAGVVLDRTGAPVPDPIVTLTNPQTGQSFAPATSPTLSGVTAAQGGFEFDNIPHGTYTLTIKGPPVSGTGDCSGVREYLPLTTSVTLQIDTDLVLNGPQGTPNASPELTVLPDYRVNTEIVPPSGGTPVPTPDVSVTVTGLPGTASSSFSVTCQEPLTTQVIELPLSMLGDQFVASFSYSSGGVDYSAPQSAPFLDLENSPNVDTALLVPPTGNVSVSLTFPWRTSNGSGGVLTCPASTSGAAGCPALATSDLPAAVQLVGTVAKAGGATTQQTFTAPPSTTGTWTFSSASLTGLVPGPVSFRVTGGAFQAFSFATSTTTSGFSAETFGLTPNMSAVVGTLTSPVAGTSIAVAPSEPSLSVTTTSGGSDNIVWQESGEPAGYAFPGVYDVTFSHPGYDSTVIDGFSVGLCDTSCTATLGEGGSPAVTPDTFTYQNGTGAISLTANVTVTVTPAFTPQSGLPYPTVTLTNAAGTQVGSATLSASQPSATFPDLSVTGNYTSAGSEPGYTVTVSAPGFQTYTATEVISSDTTLTPSLTLEGYLTGSVDGVINQSASPLQGATVTANRSSLGSTGCTTSDTPSPLSATTGANGTFAIAPDGGICPGSSYDVSVSAPTGYSTSGVTSSSTVGPLTAGDNVVNGGSPLEVKANTVSVTFTVTDDASPPNDLPGVSVLGSSVIGRTVTGTTDKSGQVTLNVDPTTYTFTFSLSQYNTVTETYTFGIGEAPQSETVALTKHENTVEGTVTTPGTCAATTPCPVQGVTVTLENPNNNQTIATATTDSNGGYQFTNIADGTYLLVPTFNGYQEAPGYQESFATSSGSVTEKDASIVASPVGFTVDVTADMSGLPLTSYSVSLMPATPPSGVSLTCASGSPPLLTTGQGSTYSAGIAASNKGGSPTYTATFPGSSVVPDFYDLTVSGSGLPAQQADGLVVCPTSGNLAEYSLTPSVSETGRSPNFTPSFEVLAGQVTGAVGVSSNAGTLTAGDLTVTLTPSGGGAADTVSAACSNASGCTTGTFSSDLLAPGTYTVQASTTSAGYDPSPALTVQVTSTSPTPSTGSTLSVVCPATNPAPPCLLQVAPAPRTVDVTVDDGATGKPVGAGYEVTLSDASLGTSYGPEPTSSTGVAAFSAVEPDPAHDYAVTLASPAGQSLTSSASAVQVGIGTGTVDVSVTAGTGAISGTVTPASGYTGSVTVELCTTASCTDVLQSQTVSFSGGSPSSAGYTFDGLAPGSSGYFVEGTASPGTVAGGDTSSETVTAGQTTTGASLTVS